MKCELALSLFSRTRPFKSLLQKRGRQTSAATRGFRDSRTHHPRTVPLPDAVRDCPNERAHRLTR